jgi:RNA polymerase sigma factor (sigma-70 family)
MTGDEELDAILAVLGGELGDAELDRRAAGFRGALRRLREDPAEATRIDALVTGARDDASVIALVGHVVEGDRAAWDEIVQRYAPLVWSVSSRFQLSARDREDVAQNVWLRLVDQLGTLREPAALPGWLATTTRRECLRVVTAARKAGRRETKPDEELRLADDTAIDEEILIAERNADLREALAGLPDRCQQLLPMLLADPPYSYAEISARLNIPVGSIGPQRARCLEQLRKSYAFLVEGWDKPSAASRAAGHVHEDPPADRRPWGEAMPRGPQ